MNVRNWGFGAISFHTHTRTPQESWQHRLHDRVSYHDQLSGPGLMIVRAAGHSVTILPSQTVSRPPPPVNPNPNRISNKDMSTWTQIDDSLASSHDISASGTEVLQDQESAQKTNRTLSPPAGPSGEAAFALLDLMQPSKPALAHRSSSSASVASLFGAVISSTLSTAVVSALSELNPRSKPLSREPRPSAIRQALLSEGCVLEGNSDSDHESTSQRKPLSQMTFDDLLPGALSDFATEVAPTVFTLVDGCTHANSAKRDGIVLDRGSHSPSLHTMLNAQVRRNLLSDSKPNREPKPSTRELLSSYPYRMRRYERIRVHVVPAQHMPQPSSSKRMRIHKVLP